MTDLELTRLCAEAMGYQFVKEYGHPVGACITYFDEGGNERYYWRPLADDQQAMALVKKFRPTILNGMQQNDEPQPWIAELHSQCRGISPDLNRAICECVAKSVLAKRKGAA